MVYKKRNCDCGGKLHLIKKVANMQIFCCDSCATSFSHTEI